MDLAGGFFTLHASVAKFLLSSVHFLKTSKSGRSPGLSSAWDSKLNSLSILSTASQVNLVDPGKFGVLPNTESRDRGGVTSVVCFSLIVFLKGGKLWADNDEAVC